VRINPRNFFQRRVKEFPINWVSTITKQKGDYQEQQIANWIFNNCSGKFCMKKDVHYDRSGVKTITRIAFEFPSDLTLFHLSGMAQDQ
jgi:hypothetical protein